MALIPSPHLLQFSVQSLSSTSVHYVLIGSPWPCSQISSQKLRNVNAPAPLVPVAVVRVSSKVKCLTKSTDEEQWSDSETVDADNVYVDRVTEDTKVQPQRIDSPSSDYLSLGIKEPVYEVVEVKSNGMVSTRKISRRQLLRSSGLRPRDIRSVDPSLFLTNSMPSLLVREHAILLNLGSLRAITMQERVLIFDYNCKGGQAFLDTLLSRLNPRNMNGGPCMPFMIEVVEAALLSRVQHLEHRLMNLEPRVQALLEVLPNRLTADILEQLRISKQTLVELSSRAGALRQMLLDLLEDPEEIKRICVMGRNCTVIKGSNDLECSVPLEKQIAEEEEEEIEMLLENYLQRCESYHGHSERLLDSAKEMEDSIAVNLRCILGGLNTLLQLLSQFLLPLLLVIHLLISTYLLPYAKELPRCVESSCLASCHGG